MKFPLENESDNESFPVDGSCAFCKGQNPEGFIVFSFSAMERLGNTNSFAPADVKKSVYLIDHGVVENGGVQISEGITDFIFCSTKCLRLFFNSVVDEFEQAGSTST